MYMKRRKATFGCSRKQLTLGHYFGVSACEEGSDLINKKTLKKEQCPRVSKKGDTSTMSTHVARKSLCFQGCISKNEDCSASESVSFRLQKTGGVGTCFTSAKQQHAHMSGKKFLVNEKTNNHAEKSFEEKSAELAEKTGSDHVEAKRKSLGLEQCVRRDCDTLEDTPDKIDNASLIPKSENHKGCAKKSFRLSLRKRKQSPGCKNSHSKSGVNDNENCVPKDNTSDFLKKLTLSDLENFMDTPLDPLSLTSVFSPEYSSSPILGAGNKSPAQSDNHSMLLFSSPSQPHISDHMEMSASELFPCDVMGKANSDVTGSEDSLLCNDISWSAFITDSRIDSGTKINRYLVLEVFSQSFSEIKKTELALRLREEKTEVEKICRLRDDWLGTDVVPGDIVQVNATYNVAKDCYIVDSTPDVSIIVQPDTLLTASSISNSFACIRKSVFAEKFKGGSKGNMAMIFGQMLHKIFQAALARCQDVGVALGAEALYEVVMEEVKTTLTSLESLEQLYGLDLSEEKALEELMGYAPAVVEWCCNFLCSEPQQGVGDIEFERPEDSVKKSCVSVTDVMDIEENIWSPRFGLKGKVDVTVTLKERRGAEVVVTKRMPLELKTGKMHYKQGSIEHRAQVILYGLMMSDRYPCQPQHGGLLLYLKAKHMLGLPFNAQDKRGLLMARNVLARHFTDHSVPLPAVLKDQHVCKYCPYLKHCALYQRSLENGAEDLGELFTEQIAHLTSSHLEFFARWFHLLAEEEQFCRVTRGNAPWLSSALEREEEGHGLADMLAQPPTFFKNTGRYHQSFIKQLDTLPLSSGREVSLSSNDRVVISAQDGSCWAIAMGTVTNVLTGEGVRVALDKAVPFDAGVLYRIDQMAGSGGGIAYSNLADICTSDSEREHRLRELIIDGSAPSFGPSVDVREDSLMTLNSNQKAVVGKVLAARDYTLIHGMPGTGKTTTIAHLVQTLVFRGKAVLLTSYTHSAVDGILLKLQMIGVPFVRLGPPSRIHQSLKSTTPINLCQDVHTTKELEQFYNSQSVVAATCLGVASHPVFARRVFDVCIVDEASQITLPNVLGPLRHAHTFVLVGDHYQLPPLVRSQKAREGGLDVSLFQSLSEWHPAALISLEKQYRMNREIMTVCNSLVYGGRLQCGSDEVATRRLSLPFYPSQHSGGGVGSWIDGVLHPRSPVLFLDTDGCTEATEDSTGSHICNRFEAKLVARLFVRLTMYGLPAEEIGIVTPLRYQQRVIREEIHTASGYQHSPISNGRSADHPASLLEVDTVDKYQGRDKDCIIVSLVRSNGEGSTGSVLLDWRRINVAITRAKCKLLLVGSRSTLQHAPFLQRLMNLLATQKQIISVPSSQYLL